MRGRSWIALVTLLSFTTLTWSQSAHAQQTAAPPTPPPAGAPPPPPSTPPPADDATMAQAKQHFETGRNAYNAGDYVTAIREFKQAESLRPSPILDYNIGLANEKLGKRRVAVKYYKRYLEEQPNASNKGEVQGKVSTLEAEIAQNPGPPPGQPGQPPTAQQEQPGDMPPADPNMAAGQPGYDPYSGTAPPGQPVAVRPPPKKRSLWWIGLIIGGAVTLTVVIAVVIYFYAVNATVVSDDRGLTTVPQVGSQRIEHHDLGGLTVLRF
jgi:tetratricopeptide (TPR) repeat protein